ncbi:MAG: glycosyltransferase, partial [Candidatus Omnitrophica bacterium]|nr:glycosyltransferase [Candidatus Omnitrophota bacterium]
MEGNPDITVIVCTYNRSLSLKRTLFALIKQEPVISFDIIVVDNNSCDDTTSVAEEISKKSPIPLRYYREEKQGVAHARNRGAHEAKGRYIAYIDDDVVPDKNWLKSLVDCLESQNPKPSCIVGKIELVWEGHKPDWFPEEYETILGRYDFGNQPKYLGSR